MLRFLKQLALGLWLGSIFFFASVVAPAVFAVLPTHALAGAVVSRSLASLHWIGLVCGCVFLLSSLLIAVLEGGPAPFHARDLLIVLMMAITLLAHYGVERRMNNLRNEMGVIDLVPRDDPRRVTFNRLHAWSTRMEGSVFICGLALLYLTTRKPEEYI